MSRFAFVSQASWGHIDFGGRSFARTACELADRGHHVEWLLLRTHEWTGEPAFRTHMQSRGVNVDWLDAPLNFAHDDSALALTRCADRFQQFDACAIDRTATVAGAASHAANVPWAAVGTNGGSWMRSSLFGVQPGVQQHTRAQEKISALALSGLSDDSRTSCWLMSPYLNLSFFPRRFYSSAGGPASHFVGSGANTAMLSGAHVVATFGASLTTPQMRQLTPLLEAAQREIAGPWRILGGIAPDEDRAAGVWQPYAAAFSDARIAIGHGGNAVVWQAMQAGIPVVSLPSERGDQMYGAAAMARLGMGAWRALGAASEEWLIQTLRSVDASAPARDVARRMREVLRSGGGVIAAANLLERVARDRKPVTECEPERCCCCCVEPHDV